MKILITIISLILVACSGSGAKREPYESTWALFGEDCSILIAFEDGEVELTTECELEDGRLGVEVSRGTYEVEDGKLLTFLNESTCKFEPGDYEGDSLEYSVDGDILTLFFPDGGIAFERFNKPDERTGTWVYGCFNEDGSFEEGKLRAL